MAIQIGTVDGLINISEDKIRILINAIEEFSQAGVEYAQKHEIALGTAFQRFVEPVYAKSKENFDFKDIKKPVLTRNGNEQSPARGTFCRKMGLLDINEHNNVFQLTPLALELYQNNITIEEYAFILMTKQGIFKNGIYEQNLFAFIASLFNKIAIITEANLRLAVCDFYGEDSIEKTRIDIILNALLLCKLIVNVGGGNFVLASITAADILKDFASHCQNLSKAIRDDDANYTEYIGSLNYGIFDILSSKNLNIYTHLYPNIVK